MAAGMFPIRAKSISRQWLAIVAVICLSSGGLLAWRSTSDSAPAAASEAHAEETSVHVGEKAPEVSVEVAKPLPHGLGRETRQPGTVHVFENAELFSKVSGYLVEQHVDIGDRVTRGQLLALIDVPEAVTEVEEATATLARANSVVEQTEARLETSKAEVEAAQAKVGEMEAEVSRTKAQVKLRTKEYKRIKELSDLHSIQPQIVDEKQDAMEVAIAGEAAAEASVTSARAQVVAANARVVQAKADITHAKTDVQVAKAKLDKANVFLNYTKIVSPYDGVVTFRGFHRGDFITARDQGASVPVLTVARTDVMRVVIQVPDLDVPYVTVSDKATIAIDALPGKPFEGKVSRMANSEDPRQKTMRVEVDLPNPDGTLREGMYGLATIELEAPSKALTIPSSALVGGKTGETGKVYVVKDGHAKLVPISIGQDDGLHMEVVSGLAADDEVVVASRGAIADGAVVTVAKVAAAVGRR